jgi:hypothetical protein
VNRRTPFSSPLPVPAHDFLEGASGGQRPGMVVVALRGLLPGVPQDAGDDPGMLRIPGRHRGRGAVPEEVRWDGNAELPLDRGGDRLLSGDTKMGPFRRHQRFS